MLRHFYSFAVWWTFFMSSKTQLALSLDGLSTMTLSHWGQAVIAKPPYQRILDPDLVVFTLFKMKVIVASKIPWRRSQSLTATSSTWWWPSRRHPTRGGRSPTTLFPSSVLLPLASQLAFLFRQQETLHGAHVMGDEERSSLRFSISSVGNLCLCLHHVHAAQVERLLSRGTATDLPCCHSLKSLF